MKDNQKPEWKIWENIDEQIIKNPQDRKDTTFVTESSGNEQIKAVFQLRVLHAYVHARESLNQYQYYIWNECFDREKSALPTS